MLDYKIGRLYLVRNTVTGAGSYFRPAEVIPYLGHKVMYGEVLSYEIRLGRGPHEIKSKPHGYGQPNVDHYGQRGWEVLKDLISKIGGEEQAHGEYGRLRVSELPTDRDPQTQPVKYPEGPEEPLYSPGGVVARIFGGTNYIQSADEREITPNRDGLIWCSRRMLDLFDDTMRLGHIPAWFDNAHRLARQGVYAGAL